jgi:hypothetical protein
MFLIVVLSQWSLKRHFECILGIIKLFFKYGFSRQYSQAILLERYNGKTIINTEIYAEKHRMIAFYAVTVFTKFDWYICGYYK